MYTLKDLPVGTKLISMADDTVTGVVTEHGESRGIDEIVIRWSNGNTSCPFVHEVKNRKIE